MRYLRRVLPILIPMTILGLALLWRSLDPGGLLAVFRNQVFDEYQRIAPRPYRPAPVVIVDIDDASLRRLGQWPWPRTELAALVTRLHRAGAAAIVFDMVFAEPDRMAPANVLAAWSHLAPIGNLRAALAGLPDPDRVFARAIAAADNVVAGFALLGSANDVRPVRHASFAIAGDRPERFLRHFDGATANLAEIGAAAAGNGTFTFTPDRDLVVRRLPLLAVLDGKLYPSLIAEALRVGQGAGTDIVKSSGASGAQSFGAHTGIVAVKIGNAVIPTDSAGDVQIYYTPHEPSRFIPAWKILAGDVPSARIAGKIVLVGTSAAGLFDLRPTPLDPAMPGVEVQAEALEQILLGVDLRRPDWASAADWLFTLILGLALIFLLRAVGAIWSAVAGGITAIAACALSWHLFAHYHLLIDPVFPSLSTLAVYLSASFIGYLRSEQARRAVRGAFNQYLSPAMVALLVAHPDKLKLGGEMKDMTVLFCDIRDFTRISERFSADPARLTHLVNRFLTPMTDVILAHAGTIDKYMGDSIMAFWNAPLDDAEHARNAVRASLAMMAELGRLNARLAEEAAAEGEAPIRLDIGIGLNTGRCLVGNLGSARRFDYSVLGDAVNLASRLEGLSKTYGLPVIVNDTTEAEASGCAVLELDLVAVKGKAEAVRIYALLGDETLAAQAGFRDLDARNRSMLAAYRARDWQHASALLAECDVLARSAELIRASELTGAFHCTLDRFYSLYAARIAFYQDHPPEPDWQGVFFALSK